MRKQMQDDNEIIRLRTNIRQAAEAKVANGTLTVTDDATRDYGREYGSANQSTARNSVADEHS